MSKIRRSHDINTGISYFINIDTGERISDNKNGSGLINTLISSTKALTCNKTKDSSTAIKPNKAIKNIRVVKPIINTENNGEMIVKLLQTHPDNMKFKSETRNNNKKNQRPIK